MYWQGWQKIRVKTLVLMLMNKLLRSTSCLGETADDIARRKKLRYREEILDNMGSVELAANLFRITQTEQKLVKEHIKGEDNANHTHYKVGREVRNAIKRIGGTMPEDLPTPEKSLKELKKEKRKLKTIN